MLITENSIYLLRHHGTHGVDRQVKIYHTLKNARHWEDGDIGKATDNFGSEEEIVNRKPHKEKEESEDIVQFHEEKNAKGFGHDAPVHNDKQLNLNQSQIYCNHAY